MVFEHLNDWYFSNYRRVPFERRDHSKSNQKRGSKRNLIECTQTHHGPMHWHKIIAFKNSSWLRAVMRLCLYFGCPAKGTKQLHIGGSIPRRPNKFSIKWFQKMVSESQRSKRKTNNKSNKWDFVAKQSGWNVCVRARLLCVVKNIAVLNRPFWICSSREQRRVIEREH